MTKEQVSINDKYQLNGIGRIFNAFSQLGHAIAWGTGDVSISGKTGYQNMRKAKRPKLWALNLWIVDLTFAPIDGEDHCKRAYRVDRYESYNLSIDTLWQDIVCTIFIWIVCPPVSIIAYTIKTTTNFIKWLIKK